MEPVIDWVRPEPTDLVAVELVIDGVRTELVIGGTLPVVEGPTPLCPGPGMDGGSVERVWVDPSRGVGATRGSFGGV
jgi:hypothetical protein